MRFWCYYGKVVKLLLFRSMDYYQCVFKSSLLTQVGWASWAIIVIIAVQEDLPILMISSIKEIQHSIIGAITAEYSITAIAVIIVIMPRVIFGVIP